MALILKTGKTYIDSSSTVAASTYYGVVDIVHLDNHASRASIVFDIYTDQASRNDNTKSPIERHSYAISPTDHATYFSIATLDVLSVNPHSKAYEYVLAVQDEDANIIWTDWESDE